MQDSGKAPVSVASTLIEEMRMNLSEDQQVTQDEIIKKVLVAAYIGKFIL